MKRILAFLIISTVVSCSGGYSFTGGDVGNAKTISIDFFPNNANLVQPQLSQKFTESLRDIFVRQTPLNLVERGGDLHFEGSVVDYRIDPINAQADNFGAVAQNRITVVVNVIFINKLEPKKGFEQRFSRFADFDASLDLSTVESDLLDQITQELSENILNQSIGNW